MDVPGAVWFTATHVGVEVNAVEKVATQHGVSPQQIRLAWTLHQSPNVLAIPGTGDPSHLEENIAAGAIQLSPDELARLG